MSDTTIPEPKPRHPDQTVCDEPGTREKFCSGHLKHYTFAPREVTERLPKGHILFRCQRCLRIYEGEPLGHVR